VTETKPMITHVRASDDPDDIFETFLTEGAVIVEGFLNQAQIDALNSELTPYNDAADPLMRNVYDFDLDVEHAQELLATQTDVSFITGNTRNVTGLATKSPTYAKEVLAHPVYMALCDRYLKPRCAHYVLSHSHMINVGPGAKRQPLHRDEGLWADMPGLGMDSHLQLASVVSLTDFTEQNGATRVIPRSHRWEGNGYVTTGRIPTFEDTVPAVMPAGSAVIYTGWTIHGAGQNRTQDEYRRGLHVSYCQGWLRTEENNVLATPPSLARQLPEKEQELLGYNAHRTLGMLEMRSPMAQMKDGWL
jgi:hypothetical protein